MRNFIHSFYLYLHFPSLLRMTLKSVEGGTTIAQCDKYFLKKHTCSYPPAFSRNILLLSRNSSFVLTFCEINTFLEMFQEIS